MMCIFVERLSLISEKCKVRSTKCSIFFFHFIVKVSSPNLAKTSKLSNKNKVYISVNQSKAGLIFSEIQTERIRTISVEPFVFHLLHLMFYQKTNYGLQT